MGMQVITDAVQRLQTVLERRPEAGIAEDSTATAVWQPGSTQATVHHYNGTQVRTDLPAALGGGGEIVTPGWLFRSGIASCALLSIVLAANAERIELETLDVQVRSRSDARGILGLPDGDGAPVSASPFDVQLVVRIAAGGVEPQRLRTLVAQALERSPMPTATRQPTPYALHVEIAGN